MNKKDIETGEIKKYEVIDGNRKVRDVWVFSIRFDSEEDAREAKKHFDKQRG